MYQATRRLTSRKTTIFFILFGLFSFIGCSGDQVATLTANVQTEGDNTGEQSTLAVVNFTKVVQNDSASSLSLTFSNPEGDSMDLTLSPINGAFPTQQYNIDGSSNSMSAEFTVIASGQARNVSITTTFGVFQLNSISFTELEGGGISIESMAGEFTFNIETGGAASGTISF